MTGLKDPVLLALLGLLVASLAAFFTGAIPYPYGLFVLVALVAARILYLRSQGKRGR